MAKKTTNKTPKKIENETIEQVSNVVNNIEEIEKELKEEYKEEIEEQEKISETATPELNIDNEVELLKEYNDSSKKLDEIASLPPEEAQKKIEEELEKTASLQEGLEKKITESEKKLNTEQKKMFNSKDFSGFWNGVSYNW